MKIGIITFHNSTNYGAVLQTIALQNKLRELGYTPQIIDYICKNKVSMYKIFKLKKSMIGNIREIINIPYKYMKKRKIKLFTDKKYIITNQKFYESNDIKKIQNFWSCVICGSDQIWNYENTKFDTVYFLDFIDDKNKKISYAASFGVDFIEKKYIPEYKHLIDQIGKLSVREEQGKNIIREITGRDSEIVLDPTLLFNKEEWLKEIGTLSKKIGYKYILLYTLYNSKEIKELAYILKEKTGYKIIKICNRTLDILSRDYTTCIPSPYEFINLINNAEYVLTDSFHGVAFSINLNKKFFVYLGNGITNHSRITNLLNICGLSNKFIVNKNNFEINANINYELVNMKIDKERKKSVSYIINSIESVKSK